MSEDIEVLKHKAVHKGELCFEGLYIDKCKRLVVRNENEIELTYTEFEILLLLAQNAGIVLVKSRYMIGFGKNHIMAITTLL